MIHWDWVFTVWIISFGTTILLALSTVATEPVKRDRLLAEADLIRAKIAREQFDRRISGRPPFGNE